MAPKPQNVLVLLMLGYALWADLTYDIQAVFFHHALATRFRPSALAV